MRLTVQTSFPEPPMYAKEKPRLVEEENKKLVDEYEENRIYQLTKKGLEAINGR